MAENVKIILLNTYYYTIGSITEHTYQQIHFYTFYCILYWLFFCRFIFYFDLPYFTLLNSVLFVYFLIDLYFLFIFYFNYFILMEEPVAVMTKLCRSCELI